MNNKLNKDFWKKFEKEGTVIEVNKNGKNKYYEALIDLYHLASRDTDDDLPIDEIDMAYETLGDALYELDELKSDIGVLLMLLDAPSDDPEAIYVRDKIIAKLTEKGKT
jgi:hypothetical protein